MLTIILISLLVGFILYRALSKGKSPPEPFGLPIVGQLFFITFSPHIKYTQWAKKYGKIMQIRLGFMTAVVIDDPELAKEAYNDSVFAGTPDLEFTREFNNGKNGITFNDGPMWDEQRRFTMKHMRDFGFGKKDIMEHKILEEVKELVEWFKREENRPISVERMFNVAVINSLWDIIASRRYSYDDTHVTRPMDNFNKALETMANRFLIFACPKLAKVMPGLSGWRNFQNALNDLKNFLANEVKEHRKYYQENNPRDFIDAYLDEINRTENPKSSFYKAQGEESLHAVLFDIFQGGFAAVSFILSWSVFYLSSFPEVQRKFQQEIDRVIGKTRLPNLEDKAKMPYAEALIMEIFRKSALVGLAQTHRAMQDVTFHGYEIKKGTVIVANVYSMHHNPDIWGDPENFRPERFLDMEGNCIKRHNALMPFSVGKRACIGESLARDEVFLFMVSIFQRFNVQLDPNSPKPALEGYFKGALVPQEYRVVMEDRL